MPPAGNVFFLVLKPLHLTLWLTSPQRVALPLGRSCFQVAQESWTSASGHSHLGRLELAGLVVDTGPPRDPNGDDEEDEENEEGDDEMDDQPPVIREPEPDE
jgi:hypothetical protein